MIREFEGKAVGFTRRWIEGVVREDGKKFAWYGGSWWLR